MLTRIEGPQREKLKKLLSLANFLMDLPHSKFFMPAWSASDATDHSCGCAGCVAGWAATKFKEDWAFAPYNSFDVFGRIPLLQGRLHQKVIGLHTGVIYHFAEYFGISTEHAEQITSRPLFYDVKSLVDVTPQMAGERIKRLIAENYDPSILEESEQHAPSPVSSQTEVSLQCR